MINRGLKGLKEVKGGKFWKRLRKVKMRSTSLIPVYMENFCIRNLLDFDRWAKKKHQPSIAHLSRNFLHS